MVITPRPAPAPTAPVVASMALGLAVNTGSMDGGTRQSFADAGRTLIAKVSQRPDSRRFPKEDFEIDLELGTCTCPEGYTTRKLYRMGTRTDRTGRTHRLRAFWFEAAVCGPCPLREQCGDSAKGSGRTVRLHPQEAMLQQARGLQRSVGYAEYRQRRVVVEHRLARLVQLGVRQARYFGRTKTLFQLLMAATVANLTLVAGRVGMMGEAVADSRSAYISLALISTTWTNDAGIGWKGRLILTTTALSQLPLFATRGFRPHF